MENKTTKWTSQYFFGNKISNYGLKNGFVDYETLAKSFDCVLCNGIVKNFGDWTLENGCDYDEENDTYSEVFQWFIISDNGARILQDYTNELVYYDNELDCYIWGVTHFGTSWDYVLTDIEIDFAQIFADYMQYYYGNNEAKDEEMRAILNNEPNADTNEDYCEAFKNFTKSTQKKVIALISK